MFSVIPPVLAWLSMNMSALPLTEAGEAPPDPSAAPPSTAEAAPSKPLLLGAQLGTWAIPLINPFMVHALCHVGEYPPSAAAVGSPYAVSFHSHLCAGHGRYQGRRDASVVPEGARASGRRRHWQHCRRHGPNRNNVSTQMQWHAVL